jgi:hypothetical protein
MPTEVGSPTGTAPAMMTTDAGISVASDEYSLTVGPQPKLARARSCRDLKGEAPVGRHKDRAVRPALPSWTGPR